MSCRDNDSAIRPLDHLPEAQVAILAALDPHGKPSLPLIVDITGVGSKEIDGHMEELHSAGLVKLHAEPEPITMQPAASLTERGRTLIRGRIPNSTHRQARAMGFPFRREGHPR